VGDPIQKLNKAKRAGHVIQVVDYLTSKLKALNPNSNAGKRKQNSAMSFTKCLNHFTFPPAMNEHASISHPL
jgi:hypothetical protein